METMLVSDLDINDLYRSRAAGSVTQRLDRRSDLFQFSVSLRNDSSLLNQDESAPIGPTLEDE